ncbi:hypothetical protein ACSQ67_018470 [Phaseolus vulgaris]
MNSLSDSKALIVCGKRQSSKSMLPPPSRPGYDVTFPSNLFPYPHLAATAFPIPNSLPYILNLGELLINTLGGSILDRWFAINLQIVFWSDGGERARVIDLQTSADNDWKEEILVVLDSELALAFSAAIDSAEKWKILSLGKGVSSGLPINSS